MGVKDFYKIVIPNGLYAGETIASIMTRMRVQDLAGRSIAIDAAHAAHAALYAVNMKHNGVFTGHLNTTLTRCIMYARHGIKQLWVFDAETSRECKREEIQRRARTAPAHKPDMQQVKALISALGIAWTVAIDAEGEHTAVEFIRSGRCEYVLSGDSDVLAFGGNLLRPQNGAYYALHHDELLGALQLERAEFLKMCVLLGTDFNTRQRGVGPGTVLRRLATLNPDAAAQRTVQQFASRAQLPVVHQSKYSRTAVLNLLVPLGFSEQRVCGMLDNYERSFMK